MKKTIKLFQKLAVVHLELEIVHCKEVLAEKFKF